MCYLCSRYVLYFVVAKAKIENDPRDHQIRKFDRPLQAHLAQELHQNADMPLSLCGINQAKHTSKRTWLIIKLILCPKNTAIRSFMGVQRKTREFICTCTIIMMSSLKCQDFSSVTIIVTCV